MKPLDIYNARKSAGMTQEQAAKFCGVSRNIFLFWELGRAKPPEGRMDKLRELATHRGVEYYVKLESGNAKKIDKVITKCTRLLATLEKEQRKKAIDKVIELL